MPTENPVRRDPYSGHLIPYPVYEGRKPSEPKLQPIIKLVLGPVIIVAVGYVMWRIL